MSSRVTVVFELRSLTTAQRMAYTPQGDVVAEPVWDSDLKQIFVVTVDETISTGSRDFAMQSSAPGTGTYPGASGEISADAAQLHPGNGGNSTGGGHAGNGGNVGQILRAFGGKGGNAVGAGSGGNGGGCGGPITLQGGSGGNGTATADAGNGGDGGTLTLNGGAGANGGTVDVGGGDGGNGGQFSAAGGVGAIATVSSTSGGVPHAGGNGGQFKSDGGNATTGANGANGGTVNASAYQDRAGGSLNLAGGAAAAGGSIDLSNGGNSATLGGVAGKLGHRVAVPANSAASGAAGQWASDDSYIYFYGATAWRRAAIASW